MQIIPTTGLQNDFFKMEKWISEVKNFSRWIQVDVCDGTFTAGKTFELEQLARLDMNTSSLLWDIHLMVKEPINYVEKCMFVGACRIIGQVELMSDRKEFVNRVKREGLEVGLAFDVETLITDIPDETDEILIMGRKAGWEKREFDKRIYNKIDSALKFGKQIGIDGGVNVNNIQLLKKAGADIVYSESNYFELINGKN